MSESLLDATQREIARAVLAEEGAAREHLVVHLSGAHAYGFPSPDSDLDLKAIHFAPTAALLGLGAPRLTFDRAETIRGVEIDYTSNEIGAALAGILLGNGNFLERVLAPSPLVASPDLASLRPLAVRSLSRRVHRHYRGFATSQLRALEAQPSVKKLLYVLRTTLTGTHLLRSGELVTDVALLLDEHGLGAARELIERKRAGERTPLDQATAERWLPEVQRSFEALDAAEAGSPLPLEPGNGEELDAWLVEARRARL